MKNGDNLLLADYTTEQDIGDAILYSIDYKILNGT